MQFKELSLTSAWIRLVQAVVWYGNVLGSAVISHGILVTSVGTVEVWTFSAPCCSNVHHVSMISEFIADW